MLTDEELARAKAEDAALERALAEAKRHTWMSTPESIKAGEEYMARAYCDAAEDFNDRVENGEFLPADEFCRRLGVSAAWLDEALEEGRVFGLDAPDGRVYYPAFYADEQVDRSDLERVTQQLRELNPVYQSNFFLSRWTPLGALTPLEALREGKLHDVVRWAVGYAEDSPKKYC